jgi:pyruvate dehydrogenase E1 component alpha subunit
MGTALERHSAQTDLHLRGDGFGVPGMRCDGMDVADTYETVGEALRRAREDRQPVLVEAITYRFRGHSMADPEEYRSKEQVEEWRKRDPLITFGDRLVHEGVITPDERERLDAEAIRRVDEAVAFADASPEPPAESLYDDVYVLGGQVRGWWSLDERSPEPHRGEDERAMAQAAAGHAPAESQTGEIPQQATAANELREDG